MTCAFGTAIDKGADHNLRPACVFIENAQMYSQFISFKPQQSQSLRCRTQIHYYWFREHKKHDVFNLPRNFLFYCVNQDSVDRLQLEQSDGFQLLPNLSLVQYLDNVKHQSTEEEYTVTKPRLKKSSMARRLQLHTDQPTSLSCSPFWVSLIRIEVLNKGGY